MRDVEDQRRRRWQRKVAVSLLLPLSLSLSPGCALLASLTGSGPSLSRALPSGLPGGGGPVSVAASQALSRTRQVLSAGSDGPLRQFAGRLGVSSSLMLAKMATQAIASRIEQRVQERERQQRATQLFYSGRCQLDGTTGAGVDLGTGEAGQVEQQASDAFAKGDYDQTEKLLQRSIDLRQKEGDAGRSSLARVLGRQSALYLAVGKIDQAEAPAKRSVELREAALGKKNPEVAESLSTLAGVYQVQSDFPRAEPQLARALDIRTDALKSDHVCVAQTQHQLADTYRGMAAYGKAEPLYQQALTTRKAKTGDDSLDTAETEEALGRLSAAMGNYAGAEPYFVHALATRRAKLGADHPSVAESLSDLGELQRRRGAFPPAEASLKEALAIREKKLAAGDPKIAESLTELAELYAALGDTRAAEPLLKRALTLQETSLGKDHPDVAVSLSRLAKLAQRGGKDTEAEELFRRALAIREKKLGAKHPVVADSLSDLGELAMSRGDLTAAEGQFERALQIRQKALGEAHPLLGATRHQQAQVALQKGDLSRAQALFQQALVLREKALGPDHPEVAATLLGLAGVKVGLKDTSGALPLFARARDINEQTLRSLKGSAASSEGRLDAFLRVLRTEEDMTYSLLQVQPDSPEVANLIGTLALLRKGRSIDEAADTSRALYQGLSLAEQQKVATLREVRSRRADLALAGSGLYGADEYQRMLRELQEEETRLQAELLQGSAALQQRMSMAGAVSKPHEILQSLEQLLPAGSALIEILAYRTHRFVKDAGGPAGSLAGLRYAALVLAPEKKAQTIDLGDGATLDEAVRTLLGKLTNLDDTWTESATALADRLLVPLKKALGDAKRWYVAPDGQLNLVPLAVLPFATEEGGKPMPLIDRIEVSYLTSGRDMLRKPGTGGKGGVALFADPQFAVKSPDGSEGSQRAVQAGSGAYRGLRLGKVSPLPGTREEGKALEKLLKKADMRALYGGDASKRALLAIEQPTVLHIATHGLFIGSTTRGGDTARGMVIDGDDMAAPAPAPAPTPTASPAKPSRSRSAFSDDGLLGSMLVLAGAETASWLPTEQRDPALGNGLLTALELAGMNLWGTQLVVLSACETGRGDVSSLGQGVYGLRRAVMVAGAESLITSLWKVDDKATRDLMTKFYKGLIKGKGRGESLREAALSLRKKKAHPYYWAPFIPMGRTTELTGLFAGSKGSDEPADEADADK